MKELFLKLIVQLRSMQLYAHSAHNLVARAPFFSDHDALSSFYQEFEGHYDSAVERAIGFDMDDLIHFKLLMPQISAKLSPLPCHEVKENKVFFQVLLAMEKELCNICTLIDHSPESSIGIKQMVGDFCDKSEVRQYKQKQRIKG